MVSSIVSLFIYIVTIIWGLFLDYVIYSKPGKYSAKRIKSLRHFYLLWLYVFLCFGYMTGSDWRNYELTYKYGDGIDRFLSEPISWFIFTIFPKVIPDFVLFMGVVKCFYLYSVYKLVSTITDRWVSVLAILIPFKLSFMLIQNPFRFMIALIFVNLAFRYYYLYFLSPNRNKKKTAMVAVFGLTLVSVFVHNSCVVFLPLLLVSLLSPHISKINPFLLFVLYIVFSVFTSNLSFINELKENAIFFVQNYMEMSDYANYESEDNEAIWSVGNLLRFLFFFFILRSRNQICGLYENGAIVYGFAILYLFLSRLLILIPTGFRLTLPFMVFYVVVIIYMWMCKQKYKETLSLLSKSSVDNYSMSWRLKRLGSYSYIPLFALVIITYSFLSFGKKAWTSYDILPYSNSIPYFVVGHKTYEERSQNNLNAYQIRLGIPYEHE